MLVSISNSKHEDALAPARRRVLADEVADSIRAAIFSGRIDLGQRLIEEELAGMLNVSRGPVREALVALTQEGLITLERHRGASVAQLTESDLREIYSLRSQLERLAAEWACEKATDEDLGRIREVLSEFDTLPAPQSQSAVASLDIAFHDAIFRAAHHQYLYKAWSGLKSPIFLYLIHRGALRRNVVHSWKSDHEKLLIALEARDAAVAAALVGEHIDISYRRAVHASDSK